VADGNLLFASGGYGLGAVVLDFSTKPPTKLWSNEDSLSAHYVTPVVKDGYLYGIHGLAHEGTELRAVEMKTGKVAWSMKTMGDGTLTLIRDKLMLVRTDGRIFQINPTPAKLDVLGNFRALEGEVRAFPAVGNGLVCLRDTTKLACLK
jgi:hypothetical protein